MNDDRFGFRPALRTGAAGAIVLAVAVAVALALAGEAILGAGDVGVGADNWIHVKKTQEWLNSGWYVLGYELDGDEPRPESSAYVYGAAFNAIAHLANVVAGNEGIGEIAETADAYAVRHLVIALFALATVVCVAVAVWTLSRNRIAAVWSAAALLAIPAWTGHAMFSVKDIPVAAGYTFVTVGLVVALSSVGERPWPPSRRGLAASGLVAVGFFLGAGTRPAMWVPLLASLVAFAALAWGVLRSSRPPMRALALPAGGFALGLGGAVALHPETSHDPFGWLIHAVTDSSEVGREGLATLTAGELLSEFPPAWYLPAWTFATIPVLLFAVAAVGVAVVIRNAVRERPRRSPRWDLPLTSPTAGMLLVALQLLLLPAAVIVTGSTMSGGLRQHLYVVPAIAILAGVGAARLLWTSRERQGAWRWAVPIVLCLALIVPAVEQSRLYPYNYVYVSEVAGIGGVGDRWETESAFLSSRAAFRRVPAGVQPKCSPWMVMPGEDAPRELTDCYDELPPYVHEVGSDSTAQPRPGETWVIGRTRSGNRPPGFCEEDNNVTRPLRGEDIVMAYVLRCNPP